MFCFDQSRDLPTQLEAWNIKELTLVRRNGYSRSVTVGIMALNIAPPQATDLRRATLPLLLPGLQL